MEETEYSMTEKVLKLEKNPWNVSIKEEIMHDGSKHTCVSLSDVKSEHNFIQVGNINELKQLATMIDWVISKYEK